MTVISTAQGNVTQEVFEPIIVTPTGSIYDIAGIIARAGSYYVNVSGSVIGGLFGLSLLSSGSGSNPQLTVSGNGSVMSGSVGVSFRGAFHSLNNLGSVQGDNVGVQVATSFGNAVVSIVNGGTVMSNVAAIGVEAHAAFAATITVKNIGTLIGGTNAFSGQDADSTLNLNNFGEIYGAIRNLGATTIVNRGLVDGTIETGEAEDFISNFGTVTDAISTGGGADFVNNLRAKGDTGINLGDGDDSVVLGEAQENVFGGDGVDTVNYTSSKAIVLNLADVNANRGDAFGDVFDQVDIFVGSFRGNDRMLGDAEANSFLGVAGNDTLIGAGGNDTLTGGAGRDRLTGGTGSDRFLFGQESDGGDTITDFSRASGDKIAIGPYGDSPSGPQSPGGFRSRADNLAQDADDRFIFRTTDHSLWSDQDGSGADFAPVLLCTLTNGVNLTAADVLIL